MLKEDCGFGPLKVGSGRCRIDPDEFILSYCGEHNSKNMFGLTVSRTHSECNASNAVSVSAKE